MTSIAQLPEELRKLFEENTEQETALWQWVSEQHYRQVVEQSGEEHLLVRLKQRVDLSALAQICAEYRRYVGERGVEATHDVEQLCWGVLVKTVMGWSYETTAEQVRSNSLVRWFVGYRLRETTFSDTTLWRFDDWLREHHPRLLFKETLKVIDEDFSDEVTAVQIGDTFAMLSRARKQSHTELLRSGSQRMLGYLQQVTPSGYQQLQEEIDLEQLFGKEGDPREWWLKKAERTELEERTALAALRTLEVVRRLHGGLPPSREIGVLGLERWIALVAKVLKDEFTFEQTAGGVWSKASVRDKHEPGSYVIGSTLDPEATFRNHGDKNELGYNANVGATVNFVREIFAVTGATPDGNGVGNLVGNQKEHLGVAPPKLVYDRAVGRAKFFAVVDKASGGQTQLVARLIDSTKSSERYSPQDFAIREDGGLTCRNGVTSHTYYRSGSGEGWNYRFSARQCSGCPLMELCRGDKVKPTSYRQVYISNYVVEQRKALLHLESEAGKQDLKLRAHIERIIAALVLHNGARRAKGIGLRNADYQLRMAAVAYNLKRWAVLINEREKEKRKRAEPLDVD